MNALYKKIKNLPKPLLASIFYMIIVFFQNGVTLLTTPLFSRILSTSDYGITSTYSSWYNVLYIFVTLNLSAGIYNNALVDFEKKKKEVTSSLLTISIILSFFFFIIYIIFKDKIIAMLNLSEYLIDFMFVNFLTAPAWGFFLSQERFDYKYVKPLLITLFTFILNPIIGFVGIKLFPDSKAVAKVIGCGIPSLIVNSILLIKILIDGKCFYNKQYWKYAILLNLPLIPHYLSNVILASSDRIMIQRIINDSAAGIYGISYNLSQVIQGVFVGINAAWIPFTYKNLKAENYKKIKNYSNILLIFIGIISIFLSLFAPEIFKILAPKEYYSAIYVIPPITIGLFLSFVSSLFGNIEFYYKKNVFVMIATCIAAILNIILNSIFIPKFGFIAAGYTTAISYLILAIAHYFFMNKIQPTKVYSIKKIVGISIITFILVFAAMFFYNYIFEMRN